MNLYVEGLYVEGHCAPKTAPKSQADGMLFRSLALFRRTIYDMCGEKTDGTPAPRGRQELVS